ATKRTSAEKILKTTDMDALVIEPYANPFRTYPLIEDYKKFKYLFDNRNVECYIINTGHFMDKKVPKEVTLEIIEKIVEGTAKFEKWSNFSQMEIINIENLEPDMTDVYYLKSIKAGMEQRLEFLKSREVFNDGRDRLPDEAHSALLNCIREVEHLIK
ncbi:MAG: phosphoenolpyruvate carboxykinase, partial [Clostridiales bacterium]|nr:phosphoenolpyruvate carboxykinase [Clostridiales bacterium]